MILVDTSVWIDHLCFGENQLVKLLEQTRVLTHPFVVGELACGNLHNRGKILHLLSQLPTAPKAMDDEVLVFIERQRLMGRGIGLIDIHLLASVSLEASARLWTRDKRLAGVASALNLAWNP